MLPIPPDDEPEPEPHADTGWATLAVILAVLALLVISNTQAWLGIPVDVVLLFEMRRAVRKALE